MVFISNIEITFLGTGSAFSKKYGNNSAVVTVENNGVTKNLMIDCGRTTPDDLHNSKFSWTDIDAIFITHLHGDHVYGLEEAAFMGRYVFNKKPHLILPHRKVKNDLWEKVLKGTMANGDLDRNMTFLDYFTYEIVDHEAEYFIFNDVMFSCYTTQHIDRKKSYGLIIGEQNYIVYSSDSLMNKDLIREVAKDGCQVIFHDCQMNDYEGKVHASLSDLSSLTEEQRKLIYIMHYDDQLENNYTRIKELGLGIALPKTTLAFKNIL